MTIMLVSARKTLRGAGEPGDPTWPEPWTTDVRAIDPLRAMSRGRRSAGEEPGDAAYFRMTAGETLFCKGGDPVTKCDCTKGLRV